ncbi:NUDIX hydrolase [Pseudidiomarina salinarum]|uniref:NAD-capped RNA hydrolase NudC n=1 Tax=Pseudidiomarina salinarum TaxID=435908 RepID=A0A094IXF4_9GAMM|nr:NAD(+) diphosphatase [Pseudidiomarina salinarum]KFZ30534.1 NUDIX hydrolase [Pseudidiomarina salinarum]RUO69044.1 NAD(+) diphosphatase [Pseudidiomarina salinarum]
MTKPNQRPGPNEPAWWFIVAAGELVLGRDEPLPPHGMAAQMPMPDLSEYKIVFLGELRERNCYLVLADYGDTQFAELGEFGNVRELLTVGDEALFAIAARAKQVSEFLSTHRFCGRCGVRMHEVDWELAMHCHSCQHRCYPRISPCIIVAIRKGRQVLLARGKRHPEGLFSVLAGFVEAGEAIERTLEREVMEEAGIKIKNPRFVGTQSWPFPHSLMIGFTAEWESGELRLDPFELEEGDWFDIDKLPRIPSAGTIARRLIDRLKTEIDQETESRG